MEFILINDNKIKVMLTEDDLREFEIETEELDYSNTDTKRMFWDVLSRAKKLTGFDTDGQRVLVQLYPSRHGGCEMFVTKIGTLCSADENCAINKRTPIISERITLDKGTDISHKPNKNLAAFSFESLNEAIAVCRRLSQLKYTEDSSAYIGDDNRYYLILTGIDVSGYTMDKYSFISEFGTIENIESTKNYLFEHSTPIGKRKAVSLLSRC